jgi:hypothetical protein
MAIAECIEDAHSEIFNHQSLFLFAVPAAMGSHGRME